MDRKRVCANCGNIYRKDRETYCAIDGHYVGYVSFFTNWCRRWRKIKEVQEDE